MKQNEIEQIVMRELEKSAGLLRMKPAWVARTFLTPGKRLGLKKNQYAVGKRGFICERWLGSETEADNEVKEKDEGLSLLRARVPMSFSATLSRPARARSWEKSIRGTMPIWAGWRSSSTTGAGSSSTITRSRDAEKLGRTPKEEAYDFPKGVDLGPHPEHFSACTPPSWSRESSTRFSFPISRSGTMTAS